MREKISTNRYAKIDGAQGASFLNNSLAVLKNIMRDAGETLYFVRDAPRLTRGPESTKVALGAHKIWAAQGGGSGVET